eukprot:scaffold40144_cov35-Tisochrysis_lutea.AAC.1
MCSPACPASSRPCALQPVACVALPSCAYSYRSGGTGFASRAAPALSPMRLSGECRIRGPTSRTAWPRMKSRTR